jgi:hypothetical protein
MKTITSNPQVVTVFEKVKKVVRMASIALGTLALLAYVLLLAVVIIL